MISSPVYFTEEKFRKCLSSHGIAIDKEAKTLTMQPERLRFDLKYDLTDREIGMLTSNSLKEVKLEDRLAIINNVIAADFEQPLTMEMLESDKRVDIALKPDTTEEVICKEEIMENDVRVVKSMPNLADFSTRTGGLANEDKIRVEPDGRVISIVTEMEGRHWEQDVRGGRDVVLKM